jgi:hypothetical protein
MRTTTIITTTYPDGRRRTTVIRRAAHGRVYVTHCTMPAPPAPQPRPAKRPPMRQRWVTSI